MKIILGSISFLSMMAKFKGETEDKGTILQHFKEQIHFSARLSRLKSTSADTRSANIRLSILIRNSVVVLQVDEIYFLPSLLYLDLFEGLFLEFCCHLGDMVYIKI